MPPRASNAPDRLLWALNGRRPVLDHPAGAFNRTRADVDGGCRTFGGLTGVANRFAQICANRFSITARRLLPGSRLLFKQRLDGRADHRPLRFGEMAAMQVGRDHATVDHERP